MEDAHSLQMELNDLAEHVTPYESGLMYRIGYLADELAKKNEKPSQPKVYFAQASAGKVKIGFTESTLKTRAAALQNGNHDKIEMVGVIHGAGKVTERDLHKRFEKDRLNGEWFNPSPALLEIISSHPVSDDPPDKPCECQICSKLGKRPIKDEVPF